jgi:hypothetical protein
VTVNPGNTTDPKAYLVSTQEQLELYDSLPPDWRQLVGSLPVPQDLREVHRALAMFGPQEGRRLIVEAFKQQYPGWEPDQS